MGNLKVYQGGGHGAHLNSGGKLNNPNKAGGLSQGGTGGKGQSGGGGSANTDVIRMQFAGTDSTEGPYIDTGKGGATWSPGRNGGGQGPLISTANTPPEGSSWLFSSEGARFISTPYTSAIAITSGDFFVGYYGRFDTTNASRYVMSVVDPGGATPANMAWMNYLSAASAMTLFLSDGTTISNVSFGANAVSTVTAYWAFERKAGTIYMSKNGTVTNTLAYAGAINRPSAPQRNMQIGYSEGGQASSNWWIDLFQVFNDRNIFNGGNFTPPTSPIISP